jgi:hypothetical protein
MSTNELLDDLPIGLGHNRPPTLDWLTVKPDRLAVDKEMLRAHILSEDVVADLVARKGQLLGSASRCPQVIADDQTEKSASELIKMINAALKSAGAQHDVRKRPFLDGGGVVDAVFNEIAHPLERTKGTIERRLTLYKREVEASARRAREEEARRRQQEADRLAIEAARKAAMMTTEQDLAEAITLNDQAAAARGDAAKAAKAAQVTAAELSRSRSELGAVSSLVTRWDFKDLNRDTIDLEKLRPHLSVDAIEKALRAFIRAGGRAIGGAEIYESTNTQVR